MSTLPLDSYFNLTAPKSRTAIGLVRMATGREVPFHSRVEFPERWLPAAQHGMVHDGYQGEGVLDLHCEWRVGKKKNKVRVRVVPWLAYSCAKGARVSIRSLGSAKGYSATIDRMISNYPSPGASRWVVRLDNRDRSRDKNEEIVDVRPENVVLGKPLSYEPNTRIHFLHKGGQMVDASVEEWLGAQEGNKHRLSIPSAGEGEAKSKWGMLRQRDDGAVSVDLNECNHSLQRFDSAREYEELRKVWCEQLRDENEFVEDAITGQKLRIEDQYVLMRVIENTGEKARTDWKKMDQVVACPARLPTESPCCCFAEPCQLHLPPPPPMLRLDAVLYTCATYTRQWGGPLIAPTCIGCRTYIGRCGMCHVAS